MANAIMASDEAAIIVAIPPGPIWEEYLKSCLLLGSGWSIDPTLFALCWRNRCWCAS